MRDMLIRMLMDISDRVGGPMTFRIILQPLMASLLAIRAGMKDAQTGRSPYLWTILMIQVSAAISYARDGSRWRVCLCSRS